MNEHYIQLQKVNITHCAFKYLAGRKINGKRNRVSLGKRTECKEENHKLNLILSLILSIKVPISSYYQ